MKECDAIPVLIRDTAIDAAKGIGIILMVIGHSGVPPLFWKLIYGFHMPFFFIIAGYLFNIDKWRDLGGGQLTLKRIQDYIVPYFAMGGINLILNAVVESGSMGLNKAWCVSTLKHAWWLAYSWGNASKMPNCTPLWFLPCLFIASLFFYYITQYSDFKVRLGYCIGCVAVELFLIKYVKIQLPWNIDNALLGCTFMMAGSYIKKWKLESLSMMKSVGVLFIGILAVMFNDTVNMVADQIGNVFLFYIGAASISLWVFVVCEKYLFKCVFLSFLGRNTMVIMGFNYFLNLVIFKIGEKSPFLQNIVCVWWIKTILVLGICVLLILIWDKMKMVKRIIYNIL